MIYQILKNQRVSKIKNSSKENNLIIVAMTKKLKQSKDEF